MPWHVTDARRIRTLAEHVENQITRHHFQGREWTPDTLRAEMDRIGVTISEPDMVEIGQVLLHRHVIEETS